MTEGTDEATQPKVTPIPDVRLEALAATVAALAAADRAARELAAAGCATAHRAASEAVLLLHQARRELAGTDPPRPAS